LTYEYVGTEIELAKKYFELQNFGQNRMAVKSLIFDKSRPANDDSMSRLLKACKPLHFMPIKADPSETGVLTQSVNQLIMLLKNQLSIEPFVLSYGQTCDQKMLFKSSTGTQNK